MLHLAFVVTSIQTGSDVRSHGGKVLSGNDPFAHRGLNRYLEELSWDDFMKFLDPTSPNRLLNRSVNNKRQRIHRFSIQQEYHLPKGLNPVRGFLTNVPKGKNSLKTGEPGTSALQPIEEVRNNFAQWYGTGHNNTWR